MAKFTPGLMGAKTTPDFGGKSSVAGYSSAGDALLDSTIKGFAAICKGDYDHLPEAAFYMVGTIEEAIEKAEKMAKEAAA